MSARAIRALRGNDGIPSLKLPPTTKEESDDDHDDDEEFDDNDNDDSGDDDDAPVPTKRGTGVSAFAAMMMDDEDDESSNTDDDEDGDEDKGSGDIRKDKEKENDNDDDGELEKTKLTVKKSTKKNQKSKSKSSVEEQTKKGSAKEEEEEEEEEDLDAILNEFNLRDTMNNFSAAGAGTGGGGGGGGGPDDDNDDNKKKGSIQIPETTTTLLSTASNSNSIQNQHQNQPASYRLILQGMDPRDLDIDFTTRNSLMGGINGDGGLAAAGGTGRGINNRRSTSRHRSGQGQQHGAKSSSQFMFGPPRDGWLLKPPHYVSGGIGMSTYDQDEQQHRQIPWPYNNYNNINNSNNNNKNTDRKRWYTFKYSDSYLRDYSDYYMIQQSGDLNALIMFVAHHPFVSEALEQLSTVLYQTNHPSEGLTLLRRCLYIYECSSLISFTRNIIHNTAINDVNNDVNNTNNASSFFMDIDQQENQIFFRALFRLAKVSCISGLPRTSLAVCRLGLSLDPLRDPLNTLLILDYYALACNNDMSDQWLIHMVQSDTMQIIYPSKSTTSCKGVYHCGLLRMPNWSYSYALALFRMEQNYGNGPDNDEHDYDHDSIGQQKKKISSNSALRDAIRRFPSVIRLLLQSLNIDTTSGRSFRRDWITVLDHASDMETYNRQAWNSSSSSSSSSSGHDSNRRENDDDVFFDPLVISATSQAIDVIIKIFIQQNAKLWEDDDVLQWMYDNLKYLQGHEKEQTIATTGTTSMSSSSSPPSTSMMMKEKEEDADVNSKKKWWLLSPALMRYCSCNPTDFEHRIELLPPEANIIDPTLIQHAMVVDPNRPRFLRRIQQQHQQRGGAGILRGGPPGVAAANRGGVGDVAAARPAQPHHAGNGFFGPPRNIVNPDWPIVEVFWRSFLPWNRVAGIRPPPR